MSDRSVAERIAEHDAKARTERAMWVLHGMGATTIDEGPRAGWWYFRARRSAGPYGRGVIVWVRPRLDVSDGSWVIQVMDSEEWTQVVRSVFPSFEAACEWLWGSIGGDAGVKEFKSQADTRAVVARLLSGLQWRAQAMITDPSLWSDESPIERVRKAVERMEAKHEAFVRRSEGR